MKRKRLNTTRRQGRLYFRRETRRLSDGTPDGEILWVMNKKDKPRKVVPVTRFEWPNGRQGDVCYHAGTYRIMRPIAAAHRIREYLLAA